MRVSPHKFRYLADQVCVVAGLIYAANRWLLKPNGIGGTLTHDYLNDLLCLPLFVPPTLFLQRVLGLRAHDGHPRLWELAQHWLVFSVLFEIVLPRFPSYFRSTADPYDVIAYLAGGLAAHLIWASDLSWRTGRRDQSHTILRINCHA